MMLYCDKNTQMVCVCVGGGRGGGGWDERSIIDQEYTHRILPESLFLCASLLFESIDVLKGSRVNQLEIKSNFNQMEDSIPNVEQSMKNTYMFVRLYSLGCFAK